MSKNYYIILGLDSSASLAEIKKAYRELAKKHHPDCQDADSERFMQIQEAYDVLSNRDHRRAYDKTIEKTQSTPMTRSPTAEPLAYRKPPVEPLIPRRQSVERRHPANLDPSEDPDLTFDEIVEQLRRNFFRRF